MSRRHMPSSPTTDSSNQWYALYKYGELEDCSPHWQNFKHALMRKTRIHVEPAPPQPSRWERRPPAEAERAWLRRYGSVPLDE